MFATWKYDRMTSEVQNIRQAYDPVSARSSQHQACDRCHEKKLKCSGEKDGCDRCVSSGIKCDYTRGESRGSRRRKKGGKSAIGSPTTSTISQPSPYSPQSSLASRSRKGSVASRRSTSVRKNSGEMMLPRLTDFSTPMSNAPSSSSSAPSSAGYEITTFQTSGPHDDRIAFPRSAGLDVPPINLSNHAVPYQSQYQNYYPENQWSRTYPEPQVTTSATLDSSYITTMQSTPQPYPALASPEEYPPYNEYACFPNQGQELWQYCR